MKLSILLRIRSLAIGSARSWKTVVFASVFVVFLTASVNASSVTVQYTVNVELVPGGQPAPNISLAISIFDTVSNTGFSRYVRTNSQGSFSDTTTFECNQSNRYEYVIGGVKIRTSGAMEPGGSTSSSSEDCAAPVPTTPLNLAVSSLDYNFDRHDAGQPDCNGAIGRPVNVTNGRP